jgi:hypothetical protein
MQNQLPLTLGIKPRYIYRALGSLFISFGICIVPLVCLLLLPNTSVELSSALFVGLLGVSLITCLFMVVEWKNLGGLYSIKLTADQIIVRKLDGSPHLWPVKEIKQILYEPGKWKGNARYSWCVEPVIIYFQNGEELWISEELADAYGYTPIELQEILIHLYTNFSDYTNEPIPDHA